MRYKLHSLEIFNSWHRCVIWFRKPVLSHSDVPMCQNADGFSSAQENGSSNCPSALRLTLSSDLAGYVLTHSRIISRAKVISFYLYLFLPLASSSCVSKFRQASIESLLSSFNSKIQFSYSFYNGRSIEYSNGRSFPWWSTYSVWKGNAQAIPIRLEVQESEPWYPPTFNCLHQ